MRTSLTLVLVFQFLSVPCKHRAASQTPGSARLLYHVPLSPQTNIKIHFLHRTRSGSPSPHASLPPTPGATRPHLLSPLFPSLFFRLLSFAVDLVQTVLSCRLPPPVLGGPWWPWMWGPLSHFVVFEQMAVTWTPSVTAAWIALMTLTWWSRPRSALTQSK